MSARRSGSLGASIALHGLLTVAAVVMATPFLWLITSSLKTNEDFISIRRLSSMNKWMLLN